MVNLGTTEYTIGSLSLLAHQPLPGYEALPDYPEEQPDPSVRDVEELEGWAGSRTVAVEQGFGSDSFESRYRNTSMASTAISGIEATGYHGGQYPSSAAAKTKSGDYDLDAFYNDDSSDEYEIDDTSEEETTDSDEETDSEQESTEESTDDDEESSEEYTSSDEDDDHGASNKRLPLHKK